MWPRRKFLSREDRILLGHAQELSNALWLFSEALEDSLPPIGTDLRSDRLRGIVASKGSSLVFIPRPILGVSLARFRPYWLQGELFPQGALDGLGYWLKPRDLELFARCIDLDRAIRAGGHLYVPQNQEREVRRLGVRTVVWEVCLLVAATMGVFAIWGGAYIEVGWRVVWGVLALLLTIAYWWQKVQAREE